MLCFHRSKNKEFDADCAKQPRGRTLRPNRRFLLYSHSIVAGGFDEIS